MSGALLLSMQANKSQPRMSAAATQEYYMGRAEAANWATLDQDPMMLINEHIVSFCRWNDCTPETEAELNAYLRGVASVIIGEGA